MVYSDSFLLTFSLALFLRTHQISPTNQSDIESVNLYLIQLTVVKFHVRFDTFNHEINFSIFTENLIAHYYNSATMSADWFEPKFSFNTLKY